MIDYLNEGGGGVQVETMGESITLTSWWVSLEDGSPAGGQKQQQERGRRWGPQPDVARIGTAAAPQLRLTAPLLALQPRVGRGAATADVVDAHAAILAAQEFVVTHPGCDGRNAEKGDRAVRTTTHHLGQRQHSLESQIPFLVIDTHNPTWWNDPGTRYWDSSGVIFPNQYWLSN